LSGWLKRIKAGQRRMSIRAMIRLAPTVRVDDLSVVIDDEVEIPACAWDGRGAFPDGERLRPVRVPLMISAIPSAAKVPHEHAREWC
jgi:hypothetical protein